MCNYVVRKISFPLSHYIIIVFINDPEELDMLVVEEKRMMRIMYQDSYTDKTFYVETMMTI